MPRQDESQIYIIGEASVQRQEGSQTYRSENIQRQEGALSGLLTCQAKNNNCLTNRSINK
jgi:hypothetical protein